MRVITKRDPVLEGKTLEPKAGNGLKLVDPDNPDKAWIESDINIVDIENYR